MLSFLLPHIENVPEVQLMNSEDEKEEEVNTEKTKEQSECLNIKNQNNQNKKQIEELNIDEKNNLFNTKSNCSKGNVTTMKNDLQRVRYSRACKRLSSTSPVKSNRSCIEKSCEMLPTAKTSQVKNFNNNQIFQMNEIKTNSSNNKMTLDSPSHDKSSEKRRKIVTSSTEKQSYNTLCMPKVLLKKLVLPQEKNIANSNNNAEETPKTSTRQGIQCDPIAKDLNEFTEILKAHLPSMNFRQKLLFKTKIYSAIVEVLDDNHDFGKNVESEEKSNSIQTVSTLLDKMTPAEFCLLKDLAAVVVSHKCIDNKITEENNSKKLNKAENMDAAKISENNEIAPLENVTENPVEPLLVCSPVKHNSNDLETVSLETNRRIIKKIIRLNPKDNGNIETINSESNNNDKDELITNSADSSGTVNDNTNNIRRYYRIVSKKPLPPGRISFPKSMLVAQNCDSNLKILQPTNLVGEQSTPKTTIANTLSGTNTISRNVTNPSLGFLNTKNSPNNTLFIRNKIIPIPRTSQVMLHNFPKKGMIEGKVTTINNKPFNFNTQLSTQLNRSSEALSFIAGMPSNTSTINSGSSKPTFINSGSVLLKTMKSPLVLPTTSMAFSNISSQISTQKLVSKSLNSQTLISMPKPQLEVKEEPLT